MASRQVSSSFEHAFQASSADPHLAYRMPSIIAYLLTLAALFVFVRRRAGAIGGGVAIALACLTPLFPVFAVEARPYSMVLACLAWAMVTWQHIDRPWRAPMLALLLGSAAALHYYAVLGVVPFCPGRSLADVVDAQGPPPNLAGLPHAGRADGDCLAALADPQD
jgi:hypothetical protein